MLIRVKVHPQAKRERIEQLDENAFEIWVREKPLEGKATDAVRRVLSQELGLSQQMIRLVRGANSRNKWFEVR